ncbi:DL-methionine ABC transporter MetINQ, substrate-binding protein [Campylobacter avium LMG 24591]|uniref:DL-methionine ABC transporter MetINQ, substrate-binding protein n=1 Tax=Campylobacter avium LMG 24591 TaxID=522484 RepID=A0A222MY85_9BACT|nr:MetQ/NlpA family ABC transporter substrate-binding protein [Campylobacter avium]ASQ30698.1 DL-methionine ABC transporter MetINQ, substrate-binding protein [Campylobacter avium LMG 24591]OYD79795.1 DL-methionine ABC transporter MetINQ, substrate-binding protein [Campylobacter avium]
MKKIFAFLLFLNFLLASDKSIIIGSTPTPYGEILAFSKSLFEAKGYKLEHKEFSDYVTPNLALDSKELDANLYQHKPFLDDFNHNKGTKLENIGTVILIPMAIYSKNIKNLKDLKDGSVVSLPNDPTNESRALELLEKASLIKVKNKPLKTALDIVENKKNLKFKPLKAAQLPRSLDDVDIAVIPANYALGASLKPYKDGLFVENDKNYAIVIAVRKEDLSSEKTKVIKEVLQSKEMKEYIKKTFSDSLIPIF